jgi:hypothetical protein
MMLSKLGFQVIWINLIPYMKCVMCNLPHFDFRRGNLKHVLMDSLDSW